MISRLELKNFTVFSEAYLEFSPQLNVIVGENGTGKTHLLKIMYSLYFSYSEFLDERASESSVSVKTIDKVVNVFKADELWSLTRAASQIESEAELTINRQSKVSIGFRNGAVFHYREAFSPEVKRPVYLPPREMISLYPNFQSVYETTELEFDETWRDISVLLGAPRKTNLRNEPSLRNLPAKFEKILGGSITVRDGRFYIQTPDMLMEMPLVAEGHRKLVMLSQLISNGSIQKGSVLFWDEPEANLNAKLVRQVAEAIMVLTREGVQVFIATHSLFLLKEIEILSVMEEGKVRTRYFGLHPALDGVQVMQGDTPYDMGTITALEEELQQTDRFIEANDVARAHEEKTSNKKRKTPRKSV